MWVISNDRILNGPISKSAPGGVGRRLKFEAATSTPSSEMSWAMWPQKSSGATSGIPGSPNPP
jgi:hypothetical protein